VTDFERWRAEGHAFTFRGHAVFHRAAHGPDEGRHLLLIHGFPTASWDYHRLWPSLVVRCATVLAPDMLGFGWSDKPHDHTYRIAEQADLHEQLLRDYGVTCTWIVAHDYGVTVAQELLARHAERRARGDDTLRIAGVCFLNGGLFPESHRPRLVQRLMLTPLGPLLARMFSFGQFRQSFRALFGAATQPTEDELRDDWRLVTHQNGSRLLHRLLQYIPERRQHRERWVGALTTSTVPLRLVVGLADPVSGANLAERYREVMPEADVVPLPGVGHYPHVEAPDEVLRAIEAWMEERR